MSKIYKFSLSIILLASVNGYCQTSLPVPVNLQTAYNNGTRTISGVPGKNYWQNSADYDIRINFDPQTRILGGTVAIDYFNNSPDTLKQIIFKLYPNLYKRGVVRNMPVSPQDITDGVEIKKLSINQQDQNASQWQIDGTDMTVKVPPLKPKQKIQFEIGYTYTLNKTSHIRTGQVDTGAFFVAYFFPRIAVYDDIDGWNLYHYLGVQEFYNDFCHFNAEITVPGNYEVWATGNLKNAGEVFNDKFLKRINEAGVNDNVTNIITETDLKAGDITVNKLSNTWKFEADSVTDLAFAISNHYLWKSASLVVDPKTSRRTRVDAVFNPEHKGYHLVINYARKTVEAMSYNFPKWPYPYPHETVFDGLDQMEYPMMVNDAPYEKADDDIELTDHEIFHTMFPFYMGINETKYAWMDEGWATMGEWIISRIIDPKITDLYAISTYEANAGKEEDLPIISLSTHMDGIAYMINSYPKPALGYLYVRDMLGDEVFTKALHYYIAQWHGKHPMPYDFFNCINTGSGVNLDWFWKSWFFDQGVPDLAITKVTSQKNEYVVIITNVGTKPIPIDITVIYANGSTQLLHQSVECWKNGNKTFKLSFKAKDNVERMTLGTGYDPDVNKADNVWIKPPLNLPR
ncbi:MAG TPA: M1 family metallopeptidase [Mucilaginibacter sp.]